jgi:hypothetical protein
LIQLNDKLVIKHRGSAERPGRAERERQQQRS